MGEKTIIKLTPQQVQTIERVLTRGDRVEIVPVKDGVKMLHVRRSEAKG